jgi:hypothetical protein
MIRRMFGCAGFRAGGISRYPMSAATASNVGGRAMYLPGIFLISLILIIFALFEMVNKDAEKK